MLWECTCIPVTEGRCHHIFEEAEELHVLLRLHAMWDRM